MRIEIVIALVMLLSFFALDWFDAGPFLSIKGYNVVSTISRMREAFNRSSSDSRLYLYYGLYAIPLTSLLGMMLSYKDKREEAFKTISAGGAVAMVIMVIQAAPGNFEMVEHFGPGLWLALVATIASFFFGADFSKKKSTEEQEASSTADQQ